MLNDKRKATRRPIHYTAWIRLKDGELRGCALADISDTGARLDLESIDDIPDDFILQLSTRGAARRKCHVVWRNEGQLGVRFDRKIDATQHVPKKRGAIAPPLVPDAVDAGVNETAEDTAAAETPAEPAENA